MSKKNALRPRLLGPLALAVALTAGVHADEGMWLLNKPPLELLKAEHGFEPTPEWLERMQKSSVRFSTGGSGSVVSEDGLVMTNHHVGSDLLAKLSTPERDLLETGFHAGTRPEELKCPDVELDILWSTEDVTARVDAAVAEGMSPAEANTARRQMMSTIEDESKEQTGLLSQIVPLYQGARYHLYRYQRYTDVRLVFAPESDIAFFGGDTDNFEFPRFNLDACFFRIYENGQPLKAQHSLDWSEAGAAEGDLVFVFGHPGRTRRLYTVDHLEFLRDARLPFILRNLWRSEIKLQSFAARSAEHARIAQEDLLGVQNGRKLLTGQLAGLHDPELMGRKVEAERALRSAAHAAGGAGAAGERAGDAWTRLAAAQKAYAEFYPEHQLLAARGITGGSRLAEIAWDLVRLADELPKPSAERLREFRDSELESLYLGLYSPAPIYDDLEVHRLASGLSNAAEILGGDHPIVVKALAGKSPRALAQELVAGTKLRDAEARRRIAAGGREAVDSSSDPLIQLALALDPEARALRARFEDEVESVEHESYATIAAAQFAGAGESVYPDATFTLRMAFGTIKGYRDDGRSVPPFTTFAGLYERAAAKGGVEPFDLPERWIERKDELDLTTPFNFVCTADIIGGNSGSPVVNRDGDVVGLIFDGNIHSLIADAAYDDRQARAVAVDSRALIEALRTIYKAQALADELTRR